MDDKELIGKIHSAMYHQCQHRGYATPVDVLMDIGVLPKKKYEDWRFGRVPFMEGVCTVNLRKLSFIMSQIRAYAKKADLKPSFCYYKQWGIKNLPVRGTSWSFRCVSVKAALLKLRKCMRHTTSIKTCQSAES